MSHEARPGPGLTLQRLQERVSRPDTQGKSKQQIICNPPEMGVNVCGGPGIGPSLVVDNASTNEASL